MNVEHQRVEVTSRRQWRTWLPAHHATSPGIWLVTWKKGRYAYVCTFACTCPRTSTRTPTGGLDECSVAAAWVFDPAVAVDVTLVGLGTPWAGEVERDVELGRIAVEDDGGQSRLGGNCRQLASVGTSFGPCVGCWPGLCSRGRVPP